jgi:hypothetical protein
LHFDVRNAAETATIPSRFEAWSVCLFQPSPPIFYGCPPLKQCYVPATGDTFFSNNKAWWE